MSGARPDTWMPLYWGDYLKDTGRLTTEGHGAYLLLIADYWTSGAPLPDDDNQLAAIVRLPLAKWRALRRVLVHFFQVADGFWRHQRIDRELEQAQIITANRSEAGKEGANARWSHKRTYAIATSERMRSPLSNVKQSQWQNDAPSPSPSPKEETNSLSSAPRPPPRKRSARNLLNGHVDQFDEAYSAFPRHIARGAAERAFVWALSETDFPTLLAGVKAYAGSVAGKEPQYVAHFATWLRAKRWLDQPAAGSILSELDAPRSAPPSLPGDGMGEPE